MFIPEDQDLSHIGVLPGSQHFITAGSKGRYYMGLNVTRPVFRISDKARLKPVSSAIETSWKIEISLVASLDMILFKKKIKRH